MFKNPPRPLALERVDPREKDLIITNNQTLQPTFLPTIGPLGFVTSRRRCLTKRTANLSVCTLLGVPIVRKTRENLQIQRGLVNPPKSLCPAILFCLPFASPSPFPLPFPSTFHIFLLLMSCFFFVLMLIS